jgi:Flp pilus assembly protein TadG
MISSARALTARIKDDNEGSVAITFALMSFVMFGTILVAIDVGRATHDEMTMQKALDAAAIAALRVELSRRDIVGAEVFNLNMLGARSPASDFKVETLGNGSVKATATLKVATLSGKLAGVDSIEVPGLANADPKSSVIVDGVEIDVEVPGEIPCIHVMDQSSQQAFWLEQNEHLDASTCHGYVRSNRTQAMYANANVDVTFKQIHVKGYADVQGGGITIVDEPHTIDVDARVVGDPYDRSVDSIRRTLPTVKASDCTNANTNKTKTGFVPPGIYCGKTEFKDATLSGIYYIASKGSNAGELKLSAGIKAEGATFYLVDNKATINSYNMKDGSVLKAPTSGPTKGILFMEASNRGSNWSVVFNTCKQHSWQGLVYLPSANVTFKGFENFPLFNISIAANQLKVENWENMVWNRFAYGPDTPVRYDPFLMRQTTSSQVERPIWLSK